MFDRFLYCLSVFQFKKANFAASRFEIRKADAIKIVLLSVAWTLLTGLGGLFQQSSDWLAHSSKFYSLFHGTWPLHFSGLNGPIVYYFAYYLPPALVSTLLGEYSRISIFIWTYLGFFLATSFLYSLLRKSVLLTFGAIFAGSISSSAVLILGHYKLFPSFFDNKLNLVLTSIFEQGSWAPNQMIPTLLVSSLLYILIRNKCDLKLSIFPVSLMFFWCVFPALIAGALVIVALITAGDFGKRYVLGILKNLVVPFFFLLVPLAIYYASSNGGTVSGVIFKYGFEAAFLSYFLLTLDFVFMYFIGKGSFSVRQDAFLFNMVNGLILIVGLYRIGLYNDFFVRGTLVFRVIQIIMVANSDGVGNIRSFRLKAAFVVLFLSLSVQPFYLLSTKIRTNILNSPEKKVRQEALMPLEDFLGKNLSPADLRQYSIKENSIYEKYLMPTE